MKRLVSALYDTFHPFDQLPFISECVTVSQPEELTADDILIVHGGSDISPSLYGKRRSSKTWATNEPSNRDRMEWALMNRAKELGVPILGICRGAQLLCAMAGGFLIQHVEGHSGGHLIETKDGDEFLVNSIHHQMMQPQGTVHEMLAWTKTRRSNVYYDEDTEVNVDIEPEAVYFNDIKGFAFQWHPEMMSGSSGATQYILNYIQEKVNAGQ
jgi:gamma-glutamyl-gamma-aminobutyrate hydrolase PuuD